jgi:4-nitrophenyl phosphatase
MLVDARAFMFDLDGTLVRRSRTGLTPLPGARQLVAAIKASPHPLVVFTNASHAPPGQIARELREIGLDIDDEQVITPICTAIADLLRRDLRQRILVIGTDSTKQRMARAGLELLDCDAAAESAVVFVAHTNELRLPVLEAAAKAVRDGARFLTASNATAYASSDGPIISRGAMITAAIAKGAGRRPTIVGKPSRAAARELSARLGVPSAEAIVIGDDLGMDIVLGKLMGARTVLVRSGISARHKLDGIAQSKRPDLVVDSVLDLLSLLERSSPPGRRKRASPAPVVTALDGLLP